MTRLEELKEELHNVNDEILELKKRAREIEGKYTLLIKEDCKKNIGRCFKKLVKGTAVSYCKVVDIDRNNGTHFNKYQYPSLFFKYPYNNSTEPFYEDDLFSGVWGDGNNTLEKLQGVEYEEISNEEFMVRLKEINEQWTNKIENISK